MAIETFLSSMGHDLSSLCEHIVRIWLDLRQDSNQRVVLGELSAQELLFALLHADVLDRPTQDPADIGQRYITPEDRTTFEQVVRSLSNELIGNLECMLSRLEVSDQQISLARANDWVGLSLVLEIPKPSE